MTFTLAKIRAAGSRVTEFHGPFKAEGTDIRNAFGVIVGAGIDEVHANVFAASGEMLEAAREAAIALDEFITWAEQVHGTHIAPPKRIVDRARDARATQRRIIANAEGRSNG